MLLRFPKSLLYPVTVVELLKAPGDHVNRSEPLFAYSYKSIVTQSDEFGDKFDVEKTFPTRLESEKDGTVKQWKIKPGDVISGPNAPLAEIEESCSHDVQYGGMCVNCGKDVTAMDYVSSIPDSDRANTALAHIHTALRISKEEAARVDNDAKQRLLGSKRLSLVVDLDLTIIQATVDPTIGEWQRDKSNPNYEAVKDVRSFHLWDESLRRDVAYYVKLRPGLEKFLQDISNYYELHIYTMGTRAYADNIAKIVDPERKLFGDRILSRTETPGEEVKNLHKLFPVDTRMVVIIDDRADVWRWSNYLVRVTPYNFFVGIGDINASFLPKLQELAAKQAKVAPPLVDDSADPAIDKPEEAQKGETISDPAEVAAQNAQPALDEKDSMSTVEQFVAMRGSNDTAAIEQKTAEQGEVMSAQMTDRPLLQKQLEKEKEAAHDTTNNGDVEEPQALLRDDDNELQRLEKILITIHQRFYEQYRNNQILASGGRVATPAERSINDSDSRDRQSTRRERPISVSEERTGGTSSAALDSAHVTSSSIPALYTPDSQSTRHATPPSAMLDSINTSSKSTLNMPNSSSNRNMSKPNSIDALLHVPDVKEIIEPLRSEALKDAFIVFSGVIPQGEIASQHQLGRMATRLGATLQNEITRDTTHLVARRDGPTSKMRQAARHPQIDIVSSDWLVDSSVQWWTYVDEFPYSIDVDPGKEKAAFSSLPEEDGEDDTASELDLPLRLDTVSFRPNDNPLLSPTVIDNDAWADMENEFADLSDDDGDEDEEGGDVDSEIERGSVVAKRKRTADDLDDEPQLKRQAVGDPTSMTDESEDDDTFEAGMAAALAADDDDDDINEG